jgi:hypothetical protein
MSVNELNTQLKEWVARCETSLVDLLQEYPFSDADPQEVVSVFMDTDSGFFKDWVIGGSFARSSHRRMSLYLPYKRKFIVIAYYDTSVCSFVSNLAEEFSKRGWKYIVKRAFGDMNERVLAKTYGYLADVDFDLSPEFGTYLTLDKQGSVYRYALSADRISDTHNLYRRHLDESTCFVCTECYRYRVPKNLCPSLSIDKIVCRYCLESYLQSIRDRVTMITDKFLHSFEKVENLIRGGAGK